jgi:replicative DNA helicase
MNDWVRITGTDAADRIQSRMADPVDIVPTGLPQIDAAFMTWGCEKGVPRGEYMICAGASNSGKTQFGLHMLLQAGRHSDRPSGIISLEMPEEDLLVRLHQALVPEIPSRTWRPDRWEVNKTWALLRDGLSRAHGEMPGEILALSPKRADLSFVVDTIRQAANEGLGFVVVDHIQNIPVKGYAGDKVAQRAQVVSEELRRAAFGHRITVCALSQLYTPAARDKGRSPTMHDVWGGTPVVSEASIVLMLDHSRYERDPLRPHLAKTFVRLDKNRMGPKGFDVAVEWNHATLALRAALPDEERSWPGERAA